MATPKQLKGMAFIEFDIHGEVSPHDKARLVTGGLWSTGTARMGMPLHFNQEKWGAWCGGVIDHNDLRRIRDAIDDHLCRIDAMSDEERKAHSGTFSERRAFYEKQHQRS